MGMFSWIDVTDKENICDSDRLVTLLVPEDKRAEVEEFFGCRLGERGVEGRYDGYGRVSGIDAYDLTAFLNICASSDDDFGYLLELARNGLVSRCRGEETAEKLVAIRSDYKGGIFSTLDGYKSAEEGRMEEFRMYGVDIGCYDEDNARLPYPIKLTVDPSRTRTYENSSFSMGDPNQGFEKARLSDKELFEFHPGDWMYEEGMDEDDAYNAWMASDDYDRFNNIENMEDYIDGKDHLLTKAWHERNEWDRAHMPEKDECGKEL